MIKRNIFFLTAALFLCFFKGTAQSAIQKKMQAKKTAVFSNVSYIGDDQVYYDNPLKPDEFYTPVLQGCYPDPAITKKGDDYYMVCSSFAMFPGVPIFHSKDLVNWTDLGGVLNNAAEFNPHDTGISEGVYAPGITYNSHNDTFYMIVTAFSGGLGNIIVKTKDPVKGWGSPIKLDFGGIDPSIFFDDNGKGYIVHNDAPDKGKQLYEGHRVIKIWEYDLNTDKVIPGTDKIIVDGGIDLSKKPIWIEAPHLYKKNGKYYLMCAEGGTGDNHSEVIFVSDNPKGPFKPESNNPILTQRYFPKDRGSKVDWAGHADLIQGSENKYYGVFLGIRPNNQDRVNTGRETFILPVDWSGDFPVFENGLIPLQPKLKMPAGVTNKTGKDGFFPNGNFTFTENFTSKKLDYRWIGLRGPRENFISLSKKGLEITPFEVNIKEVKPTSTLFYRQQHNTFSFTATVDYKPQSDKDLAGIACLQNERSNYVFGITKKGNDTFILLERTEKAQSKIIASSKIKITNSLRLRVKAKGDNYEFSYAVNGVDFENLGGPVSGDILSTNIAGGFTGALIGLYATAANDAHP